MNLLKRRIKDDNPHLFEDGNHKPIIIFDVDGPLIPNIGPRLLVLKFFNDPWFAWNEEEKKKLNSLEILRLFESAESKSNRKSFNRIRLLFKDLLPNWFKRWSFIIALGSKFRQYEYRYDDFIPGATELIHELHEKEILMGICSNSEEGRILKWLKMKNIQKYIPAFTSRGYKAQYGLKPDPRPVLGAIALLKKHYNLGKIDRDRVAFVGDNVTDIVAANRAGVRSIAVLSGHGYKHELEKENPTFILNSILEIPSILSDLFPDNF